MSDEWLPAEQTATNPKTGERLGLIGGKWEPIEASATNHKTGARVVQRRKEAGWGSVVGNAVMRGGVKAAAVVPFIEGGLASAVGATETADEAFKSYDEAQELAKYWTPEGHQSTAKQVVGGLSEMILPGMLTAGSVPGILAPSLVSGATERTQEGVGAGTNVALTATEAAAGAAGMHMPFNIGGGVTGVAKAAAAQGGIGLADVLARLGISSADSGDKAASKIAEQIKRDGPTDVGLQVLAQAFGGSLAGAFKYLKARGKKPAAEPKPAQEADKTPEATSTPNQTPDPAKTAPVESQTASANQTSPPPQGKTENPTGKTRKESRQEKARRQEEEWFEEMSAAGDLSDMAPAVGEERPAAAPDAAAGQEPALSRKPILMKGDLYGQHPLVGLTDLDRLALHAHAPEQHPLANASPQKVTELAREAGLSMGELKARGQALDEFITARHNELVGAQPGGAGRHDNVFTRPEGVREPIDVSSRRPPEPSKPEPKPEAPAAEVAPVEPKPVQAEPSPGRPGYKEHLSSEEAANRAAAESAMTEAEKAAEAERSVKEVAQQKRAALPASQEVEEHYAARIQSLKEQLASAKEVNKDYIRKQLKAAGMELSAARRAHNNAETAKEIAGQRRNLLGELRKAGLNTSMLEEVGRQLDMKNGWEANKRARGLFTKDGPIRSLDALLEWMKGEGWIQEWEAERWDRSETGGAKQLAADRLEQELADSGSNIHIQDADKLAERADMYAFAKAHGLQNESELTIRKAMVHAEQEIVLAEANALINELTEEAKGGDLDAIFRALGKTGSRAGAVAGLLAASEAARADDGSETDASNTLLYVAVAVAAGGAFAYKNRKELFAALKKNASPTYRDWLAKLWRERVKETGAKTVVDLWRGRAEVMTRKVMQGMPHIEAMAQALKKQGIGGGERLTAHELSRNTEFLSRVAEVASMYEKAKWKDKFGLSVRLNAALEHWDITDAKTKDVVDAFRMAAGGDPTQDFPMFHYEAGFAGIQEGLDMGMKLRYNDAATLYAAYGVEAMSSLARGAMLRDLKNLVLPNGMRGMHNPMVEAPKPEHNTYVPIGESWGGTLRDLEGWKIHPDLVNDFKLSFNTYTPSMLTATLGAISNIAKRLTFESLFHARTLIDGFIGKTIGSLDKGLPEQLKGLNPKAAMDAALKLYREGGDPIIEGVSIIDRALMHGWGLEAKPIDFRLGQDSVQSILDATTEVLDAWVPLPKAAVNLQEALGRALPKGLADKLPVTTARGLGGLTTGEFRQADRQIQRFTWEYVRPSLQIMALLKDVEVLRASHPERTIDEIVASAVQNSHNTFGGQDWRRVAYRFNSKFGRDVMANVLSGRGQYYLSILMVAPDWFVSTAQTWLKAVPKVKFNGWKSLPSIDFLSPDKALALRYLLGSAVYMAAVPNVLNYMNTGHWMWENESEPKRGQSPEDKFWEDVKRKLQVDRGDGTYVQYNKHLTDFPEILIDAHGGTSFPTQTALNKMAAGPRAVGELAFNQQYLSTKWAPKITEKHGIAKLPDYAKHLAEKFMPIPIAQLFGPNGAERAFYSGVLGTPIRGYTAEEMADLKAAERERKRGAE
jgi:hypothetical protein